MGLKEMVDAGIASKKKAGSYVDEVRLLLPMLQEFMECVLEAQDAENQELVQYLLGIAEDTVFGIENQDETLLRDVLEYGWGRLIIDVLGEEGSGTVQEE